MIMRKVEIASFLKLRTPYFHCILSEVIIFCDVFKRKLITNGTFENKNR